MPFKTLIDFLGNFNTNLMSNNNFFPQFVAPLISEKNQIQYLALISTICSETGYHEYMSGCQNLISNDYSHSLTKSEIMKNLKIFFNSYQYQASILFLSGHGGFDNNSSLMKKEGYLVLELKEGKAKIYYYEIAQLWFDRTNKNVNQYLLIIIDACHSGTWVDECREKCHFSSIYIQASCLSNQKSNLLEGKGGIMIQNLIEYNWFCKEYEKGTSLKNQVGQMIKYIPYIGSYFNSKEINIILPPENSLQIPISTGFRLKCKEIFNLYALFDSWKEMKNPFNVTPKGNFFSFEILTLF